MSTATRNMTPAGDGRQVELAIGGMTCASCAARIEKKLNRMAGVTATVNYATEKARVSFSDDVSVDALVATVEATGYTATPAAPPPAAAAAHDAAGAAEDAHVRPLRIRLIVSAALSAPVVCSWR